MENKKKQYLYKILNLFYPQQVKRTQQSGYPVPNEYIVGVKVNSMDSIAKTQYTSFGKVVYTITWNSCNEKKVIIHREIIYIDIDRYIALNRFISIIKYRYISINWIKIDILYIYNRYISFFILNRYISINRL